MATHRIEVPIYITAGTTKSTGHCTITVDQGEVDDSEFHKVLRETFAKHLREMADIVERDGLTAVGAITFEYPVDDAGFE